MSIFDREPVNRKDRRKLAKELQKEQTDFRMSAIGRKIEIENQARQKAIERLSQQGISPADLKAEYDKIGPGFTPNCTDAAKAKK